MKFIFSQINAARSIDSSCDGVNKKAPAKPNTENENKKHLLNFHITKQLLISHWILPLAKKLPESLISESESSGALLFHKTSENFDVFGFGAKFVLLRLMRNSEIPLSCSASDVLPAPNNDIFQLVSWSHTLVTCKF